MFCHVFLRDAAIHPTTYEVCTLINETAHVGARFQVQMQRHTTLSVALLRLLQIEFNESFRQALERRQQVHWPDFGRIRQDLATGNSRPDIIALPGAFKAQVPGARVPMAGAPPENSTLPHPRPRHTATATGANMLQRTLGQTPISNWSQGSTSTKKLMQRQKKGLGFRKPIMVATSV